MMLEETTEEEKEQEAEIAERMTLEQVMAESRKMQHQYHRGHGH